MKLNEQLLNEISELVVLSLEEGLDKEGQQRLEELIEGDSSARRYYFRLINIYLGVQEPNNLKVLHDQGQNVPYDIELWKALAKHEASAPTVYIEKPSEEPEEPPVIKPARGERKMSKFSIFTLAFSAAAMIFLSLIIWIVPAELPVVASLGYTIDAVWRQTTEEKVMGEDLETGGYYLEKGLVQILFYNGAKVILEGPADFDLSSTSTMELFSGKLVANVNREAAGFTVKTPSARVLDLGTEFAVDVDLSGNSDIHVFDGEVVLYPQNNGLKVPLLRGKAKRVTTSGKQKDIEFNKYAFICQDEFNSNVRAQQGDPYNRWLAYSYQLRRDPDLVAYYTFEEDNRSSDKLKNVAVATAGRCDGLLLSESKGQLPTWTQGRWPNKTALKFDRSQKQLVEISSDPVLNIAGPITVSAWINCAGFNEGGNGFIVCNRTRDNINYQMSYGLTLKERKNVIGFGRYAKFSDPIIESQKLALAPGTWHHLVVSHNNREVRYYIDGRLYSVKPHIFQHSPVEAKLLLGSAKNNVNDLSDRMFNGIMGEVAIFKRVLSGNEIAAMYEAGRPK